MTRWWPGSEPLEVEADALGAPLRLTWRGEVHVVAEVALRWRLDEKWWSDSRVWREYFKLATDSGLLVVVYHDLLSGEWKLLRLYD